jgi:hypothetical protein
MYKNPDIDFYLNSLNYVLFGEGSINFRMRSLFSRRIKDEFLIISILNIHLLLILIKVFKTIGFQNLIKVIFIHVQIANEMAKINKLKSRGSQ